MSELTFVLHITPDQYLAYYNGAAKTVAVTTEDGLSLKFPANALQKFITREGIHGRFKISFDQNNKLIGISRV